MDEFKTKFGGFIELSNASYNFDGKIDYFKYDCDTKSLKNFRHYVNDWLKQKEFFSYAIILKDKISLYSNNGLLSDEQISDFENEFCIRCNGYSKSCNSNKIEYNFSYNTL